MKPQARASTLRVGHRSLRRAMRSIVPMLLAGILAGCTSAPASSTVRTNCGGLPPPFSAPVACPVAGQPVEARPPAARSPRPVSVEPETAGCFTIERSPDAEGGLNMPRQIVCPAFAPRR